MLLREDLQIRNGLELIHLNDRDKLEGVSARVLSQSALEGRLPIFVPYVEVVVVHSAVV